MDLLVASTSPLRQTAIARHLGSLPGRLKEVLDEALCMLVSTHPLGVVGAQAYGSQGISSAQLAVGLLQVKEFDVFAWGSIVTAMLKRGVEGQSGSCPKDTTAGLGAVEDRVSLWAYDLVQSEVASPAILLERMDQMASAFAVGAGLGWAGVTSMAPKHVRHVRAGVARMPADERALLLERYHRGRSRDALCAAHGHSKYEASLHFGQLLEGVRQLCLVA